MKAFRDLLAPPGHEGAVFAEPWQARAFALVVALSENGLFSLGDFQAALTARIGAFEQTGAIEGGHDYYTRWIEALGDLLAARGVRADEHLRRLEAAVIEDAASKKAHQMAHARDETGRLRIAPLVIDPPPGGSAS